MLRQAGLRTGMSCTDGVYIGDRCVFEADASGPRSAEMVLDDTSVEAAVLETARGGIIRRGLGYDKADVAVITNIGTDHLGDDGIDELDELVSVKALIAEEVKPGGCVVLNASDQAAASIAERPRGAPKRPGGQVLQRDARRRCARAAQAGRRASATRSATASSPRPRAAGSA